MDIRDRLSTSWAARTKRIPTAFRPTLVGADFFETLGIPILQGRAFNRHDTATSPKVAIVNRALAQKFFLNENPIGKTFETDQKT
jgi:hypothetical protein